MKKAIRPAIFKWRQTEPELILCAVRWYLRYSLSFRDVEELLNERGLEADRTTIWRWVTRTRHAARRTIQGYEAMHMIRKGQARGGERFGCSATDSVHQQDEGRVRSEASVDLAETERPNVPRAARSRSFTGSVSTSAAKRKVVWNRTSSVIGLAPRIHVPTTRFGSVGIDRGCFIRELLFTCSLSSTTCNSAWVSRGFSVIKHV